MLAHRAPVISAAARNNVPAVYSASDFARDGGLLSYGPDVVDPFRRAATYVDRILCGEKPGDLPVQLPVKYEMAVNLKTAKALGLAVSPPAGGRAAGFRHPRIRNLILIRSILGLRAAGDRQ
jgi:putative ABC transport system substrate-binding protein